MCGIAGFIGLSKKPKASYEIMTSLFDFLEIRGIDASGVWATEAGENGKVYYQKESIKSSEFVAKKFWKDLQAPKLNLLIAHARATSKGGGHAFVNSNNHPFVSLDRRIGMVHNGTLDEATFLSKKYQCFSKTDSEVILRIFENGIKEKVEIGNISSKMSHRLAGIRDIWSVITKGAMAVAIGEREESSERNLFLFRNEQRPLWIADLRDSLGQIFFFSSPDVWYQAMFGCSESVSKAIKNQKIIEIPSSEVWVLSVDDKNPQIQTEQFHRFKIDVQESGIDWGEEYFKIQPAKSKISVVTELDDYDAIKSPIKNNQVVMPRTVYNHAYNKNNLIAFNAKELSKNKDQAINYNECGIDHECLCDDICAIVSDIKTMLSNSCSEETISMQLYHDIIESLENTKIDLRGTLRLTEN